ncbi:hypothetical protein BBAD15_g1777 [Beauveria bassiana D1-5]|uniref:Uncharacterized protein n=1 Tax=Beauveria bassiana D1-5 TaxID=1245745 RepID=A0A0A2VXV4_BEABA|nr:hypothetical protein BBAD15_g1777 [Beauveria bassiana D1-5]
MHIVRQQRVQGVAADARHALGAHALHDERMSGQRIAVPDAPRAQQQRIEEVAISGRAHIERLAAVEQERYLDVRLAAILLKLEQLGDEISQRASLRLLADEVKA